MKETRLANLLALVEARRWRPADLVREVGKSPSYWSDMLRGAKGFGEAVAREIEDKLGLPTHWLDQAHSRGEAVPTPASDRLSDILSELARAIASASKLDRLQLEVLLPLLASQPDTRHETCEAIARLLQPGRQFEYLATWEETARDAAAEMAGAAISPEDFVAAVDAAHAKHVKLQSVATDRLKSA